MDHLGAPNQSQYGAAQGRSYGPGEPIEAPQTISEVGQALSNADTTAHEVYHRVESLYKRLQPVLRPQPPSATGGVGQAVNKQIETPLATGIRCVTETQQKTLALLGAIHESLAL